MARAREDNLSYAGVRRVRAYPLPLSWIHRAQVFCDAGGVRSSFFNPLSFLLSLRPFLYVLRSALSLLSLCFPLSSLRVSRSLRSHLYHCFFSLLCSAVRAVLRRPPRLGNRGRIRGDAHPRSADSLLSCKCADSSTRDAELASQFPVLPCVSLIPGRGLLGARMYHAVPPMAHAHFRSVLAREAACMWCVFPQSQLHRFRPRPLSGRPCFTRDGSRSAE
ncbi:hypothetical protein B0H17DRAFT_67312 [Mycena rosella]|uniref:Uncharacterized protein n=1 Tax=Mycena rosella TaxID=1033263 RepID=A0AAD7DZS6_MYCRO|nr:hypothetical protein B0H17DRAFT_67312 [Mycena rosella]